MPDIPVTPLVMKDVLLTLGTDNHQAAASAVVFTPQTNVTTVTWKGLTPSSVHTESEAEPTAWTVAITYAQDWDTAGSLSQFLMDNAGDTVPITFAPRSGSGPSFTADVVVVPGPIGGTRGQVAESTVTMSLDGQPTRVPAV